MSYHDLALQDALEQFKDQATYRLLLSALEGCEDPGTTLHVHDKNTAAKMLPSTLRILVCKDVQSAFLF